MNVEIKQQESRKSDTCFGKPLLVPDYSKNMNYDYSYVKKFGYLKIFCSKTKYSIFADIIL